MILSAVKSYQFWTPMILGYGSSMICSVGRNAGVKIKARPPAFVFGIVWPILYVCLGLAWFNMKKIKYANILFIINALLGSIWLYLYGCKSQKKNALYVIILMLSWAVVLYTYALQTKSYLSSYLIIPYAMWLLFATMLNFKEVNSS